MPTFWTSGLRAFKYKNYRLWFIGQLVSLIGSWMNSVAASWLIFRLTDSEFLLGLNFFFAHFPIFLLGPLTGVLADRMDTRRLLFFVQLCSMLQSFAMAALVLLGDPSIHAILALSALQGIFNAFDLPARQTLMAELVEQKEDLPNAIALNSVMFNSARVVGPSIGGLVVSLTSEGIAFLIDGISYAGVLITLFLISSRKTISAHSSHSMRGHLIEGVKYVARHPQLRNILILVFFVSLFSTPYLVLLSAMVKEIYRGGPLMLGVLTTCSGMGALSGALLLAWHRDVSKLPARLLANGIVGLGALITLSFLRSPWIAGPVIFLLGAGLISLFVSCNTILQTLADDDKRGRVMSFYGMAMMGTMPIGALIAGTLAHAWGLELTILIGGVMGLGAVLWYAQAQKNDLQTSFASSLRTD